MPFEPGKEKTGGREKGTPNKLTQTVKERVLEAFNELQEDSNANLVTWGIQNPGLFYQIAAKLIPTEVNANLTGKIITVTGPKKQLSTDSGTLTAGES